MNQLLKILFLVDDFPPVKYTSGGKVAYALAVELAKRGHKVFIITSVQDRKKEGRETWNGLDIFRIYSNYHPRWRFWITLYNPQTVFKVEKIMKEIKPDVVNFRHIHQYLSFACFKIAKKYAKAVFLTANDVLLINHEKVLPKNGTCLYKISIWDQVKQARKRYNPFRDLSIRHYLKYVDKIFSISNALKELLEMNGINNVITIYNGIDVEDWKENKDETSKFRKKYGLSGKRVILFGGRLGPSKGTDAMLEITKIVSGKIKNAVLMVVGDSDWYAGKMKQLAEDLGIKDKVIFTGFLTGEELKSSYYGCDVYAFPSICFEGLGMSCLEAMACAKPVAATCFGGTRELIIDGENGYVINPLDVGDAAKKIIDLLDNSQKAQEFGRAGYELAKNKFSLDEKTDETIQQYYKFLSESV